MRYSLYEVDRSYYRVTGRWEAHDDFHQTGFENQRHKETLRIVASNEDLARAMVESWHKTGFDKRAEVHIDEIRSLHLNAILLEMT